MFRPVAARRGRACELHFGRNENAPDSQDDLQQLSLSSPRDPRRGDLLHGSLQSSLLPRPSSSILLVLIVVVVVRPRRFLATRKPSSSSVLPFLRRYSGCGCFRGSEDVEAFEKVYEVDLDVHGQREGRFWRRVVRIDRRRGGMARGSVRIDGRVEHEACEDVDGCVGLGCM